MVSYLLHFSGFFFRKRTQNSQGEGEKTPSLTPECEVSVGYHSLGVHKNNLIFFLIYIYTKEFPKASQPTSGFPEFTILKFKTTAGKS